jgi:hypothetical protein
MNAPIGCGVMYYKIGMIFSTMLVCYEMLIIPCLVHGYFVANFINDF